jgi:hypothetical protein
MFTLIFAGGFLSLFALCFLAAGVLGRGWFLWTRRKVGPDGDGW